jgi:hypothetical protein
MLCLCPSGPTLSSSQTRPLFEDYAAKCHIENEYGFYKDAINFQKSSFDSHKKAKRAALDIYKRYINSESPHAIYLGKTVVNRIKAQLSRKYIGAIYQEAALEVGRLLETHFRNFVHEHGLKTEFTAVMP